VFPAGLFLGYVAAAAAFETDKPRRPDYWRNRGLDALAILHAEYVNEIGRAHV